jgi:hypothetical protein
MFTNERRSHPYDDLRRDAAYPGVRAGGLRWAGMPRYGGRVGCPPDNGGGGTAPVTVAQQMGGLRTRR